MKIGREDKLYNPGSAVTSCNFLDFFFFQFLGTLRNNRPCRPFKVLSRTILCAVGIEI